MSLCRNSSAAAWAWSRGFMASFSDNAKAPPAASGASVALICSLRSPLDDVDGRTPDPTEGDRLCAPRDDPDPRRGIKEPSRDSRSEESMTIDDPGPDVGEVIVFESYATTYAGAIAKQT